MIHSRGPSSYPAIGIPPILLIISHCILCCNETNTREIHKYGVIYICLRLPLRNMILQKVLTRPYAAQGFAYAGYRYDNTLIKHE